MDTNAKISLARQLMDKLHERNRKQAEGLERLCAVLCELAAAHGEACGADPGVVTYAIEPKQPGK